MLLSQIARYKKSKTNSQSNSQTNSQTNDVDTKNEVIDNFDEKFIKKLNSILESVYSETSIGMAAIAKKIAMSERQFFRKLNSVVDMTPAEYLRRFRLEKSKLLLTEGQIASYVAIEVGFATHSHFGKCFKAQYGLSPSEYKRTK